MKIISIAICFLFLVGCSNVVEHDDSITIGVSLPLSGDLAGMGQSIKNAIEMAFEEQENTYFTYSLIFEDNQFAPKEGVLNAQKFIAVDDVDAIFSFSSPIGNVISPITQENKVIHFGFASDPAVKKGLYNFIHTPSPEVEIETWIAEAIRRNTTDVAVLIVQSDVGLLLKNIFSNRTDINIVALEEFSSEETSFQTIIEKTRKENPSVYYIFALNPQIELLYKQMRELGITEPISTSAMFETSQTPELFNGEWYQHTIDPSETFNQKYEQRFGTSAEYGAAFFYDISQILIQTWEDEKTADSYEIAQALESIIEYEGVFGKLTQLEDGHFSSGALVKEIQNGTPVSIQNS